MSKRRPVSVYLTDDERKQLARAAQAEQRSISLLARMLVLAGLQQARQRRASPPRKRAPVEPTLDDAAEPAH